MQAHYMAHYLMHSRVRRFVHYAKNIDLVDTAFEELVCDKSFSRNLQFA
jgi:hypothetical protein